MAKIYLYDLSDAIIDALKADTQLWGAAGKLKTIKEYEGDAEDYLNGMAQSIPNTPAALLLFNEGEDQRQNSNFSFGHPVSFSVMIISGDLRGGKFRKRELLELYEIIHADLAGKRLGLEMDPIEPKGWRAEFEGARHSALTIDFEAVFDYDIVYDFPS